MSLLRLESLDEAGEMLKDDADTDLGGGSFLPQCPTRGQHDRLM
jgi:hypothetical protein